MDTKIAAVAEEIPSGNCVQALIKKAAERDVYIIAGLYEKEGIHLYNSAVLVGPEEVTSEPTVKCTCGQPKSFTVKKAIPDFLFLTPDLAVSAL